MSKEVGTPRYLSLVVPLKKVDDEAVHKELGDRMEKAATTASSLEAEQDSGSGPRCQDTILGDVDAQTRLEIASKQSNDPPLSRGYTLGSGEDKSDGFAEIIDFLKASSVYYALTVNPIIYTSCIEHFLAATKVQMVNGVRQLQALVDKKRVFITESSIRSDLHLDGEEADNQVNVGEKGEDEFMKDVSNDESTERKNQEDVVLEEGEVERCNSGDSDEDVGLNFDEGKGVFGNAYKEDIKVHNGNYAKWFGINKWYQSFALRNFDLEDMELESTNSGPTAKLPILKLGEYEMWVIRIKQYFQIQDYALWEVIENGDSWVLVPQTTQENGTSVTKMSILVTAREKTNKKNNVKARGLLLMALPNEHQLTFSQYPDAKSMFAAIETRFGGNAATTKTQKTLLKQQYENFSAISAESLDSILNRLQKIVSRLAILGVVIAQEDLNSKILSSLPPEWNTHVVVWMNKQKCCAQNWPSLNAQRKQVLMCTNTASQQVSSALALKFNDASLQVSSADCSDITAVCLSWLNIQLVLFVMHQDVGANYMKMISGINVFEVASTKKERKCQGYGQSRQHQEARKQCRQNLLSIDDLYNNFKIIKQKVKKSIGASSGAQNLAFMIAPSTSSTNDVNAASPQVSTASPNVNAASPQVSTASFSDNVVYAFMVENPNGSNLLQQDLEQIHEDDLEAIDLKWQLSLLSMREKRYYQRTCKKIFINANDTARYDKTKVECFNCHKMRYFVREYRASRNKEGQFRNQDNTKKQGNNEDISSKAILAIDGVGFDWSDMVEEQVQTNMALMAFLDSELNQTEFTAATYKIGLGTVEEQLITYRKNEVLFSEEIGVLKREVACKDYEINMLKSEFEKVKQEKDGIEFKIEKIDKASKDLDQLLGSQITDKSKKGLGYSAITPPHPLIYNRPNKLDLSYSGLDEFKEPEFKGYGPKDSEQESNVKLFFSPNVDKETVFPVNKKVEFTKPKNHEKPVKKSVRPRAVNAARSYTGQVSAVRVKGVNAGMPQQDDKGFVDSGCSRHMTRNIAYLSDFKEFDGGYVAFGGGAYGGRITGKGTLKTDNLDFKDVYFVNELKFNLFSVSQMCDKKNYVLFTDTECLVLSPNFKLPDENQILLKIPRKDNMYSFDMKNILVKDNLVRGLPTKRFENDQTCVACLKGKQHRASCKSKVLNPITKPLFMLHMDLFGPTFVSSLMHKKYCLVVTDDYSRFTWVFFLTTKDETSEILKNFIKEIENLVDKKVKIIRSDNGTEFKNKVMDDFCREKGIKREYSVAKTPQQNGVAERRNRTLIEAARTMLADSKLPTTFWAEAISTACYVQNRILVVKPHNKTPYELFRGIKPALSFMRPFGCHVTILNTLDSLGKFDGKSNEGFFVGYSLSSKAFRVYNTRTRRVEENLHIRFLENKPMIEGNGPKWLFDIDSLTQSMNYVPVAAGTITNESAGTQGELNAGTSTQKEEISQDCIVMPIWKDASYFDSPSKDVDNGEPKSAADDQKQVEDGPDNENDEYC
ncbi:putative ribonuclease H-like domain-containing protein [Tanacetum coccineum]